MSGNWSFLGSKKNREILAWLAGGLAAVVVLWTAFVYFHPPKIDGGEGKGKGGVIASHGGVSVGGNVWNSTINTSPAPLPPLAPPISPSGTESAGQPANPPTPHVPTSAELVDAIRHRPPQVSPLGPEAVPSPPTPTTVDEALASLRAANVAFNTPDKARLSNEFIVQAKLSTRLRPEELQVLIDEPGKRQVATLNVSDRMAATLSGGSAFDVSPSGPQEQWISESGTTEWNWQVTPKSAGEQSLILTFDALISLNGKEDRRTINTFKRRIVVDVGWPETAGEWLEMVKKTGENVSWIWATLLLPVGGGIWAWIKRRGRPSEQTKPNVS